MVKRIVNVIINDLSRSVSYSQEQREHIEYSLTVITYELIKLILIVLILYMLGVLKEGLAVLLAIIITKPFIGGYHEDSQLKCFIATLIITTSIIMLVTFNNLNLFSIVILNLFSIFSIYNKAPVIDSRFPLTKEHLIKKNKILSVTNSSILFLITLIFFKISWISQTITWTLLIQTLLLFNKYKREDS